MQLVELWKTFHYPPETVSVVLVARIFAMVIQAENPDEVIAKLMTFMHDTVNIKDQVSHKLLGESFGDQLEILRQCFLTLFPQPVLATFLATPDAFQTLFALIGRNGQGIGSSSFSQWVRRVEKLHLRPNDKKELDELIDKIYEAIFEFAGNFLNNEGSGLFQLQSTINHSCSPNAQIEFPFNNHELVVNALKRIEPGEEILISYLDGCDLERSRHSRRKALLENYLFACQCPKCDEQVQDPDVTSEEELSEEDEEEEV